MSVKIHGLCFLVYESTQQVNDLEISRELLINEKSKNGLILIHLPFI